MRNETQTRGDETMTTQVTPQQQKRANTIARRNGHGSATEVRLGTEDRVVSHVRYGYRKHTTGQYVPNAYRTNFGWKNTYYQSAETVVEIKGN